MPALKMKSKSSTACIKEVSCLHITQKSRKISKVSSPLVRVCCETAEADTSDQHCNNGSSKLELCTMKKGSDEANHHKMWHDGEDPAFEKYFSSAEDPVINKMDPPPPACTTNFEAMCPPLIDGSGIHFGSNTQNNEGCEDGPGVPDMKADDYDNWISESSGCQILDVPDSYISDMNVPVLNGISGFDDILNDNLFIKSGYFGQNLMFDMIDGSMKLPALEETTELVNVHFAGSCEELSKSSDNSNSRLVSHQIKPCDQEADVNLGNIESDEVDFDPQSFIRNFLDLSDMGPDLLPAPVPKETSNRNRITLVLDLDETLVHSTMGPCDDADFTFQVFFNMKEHTVYVRQRPFLRTFLERVAEMFEIIVFTASESVYAEQLLDKLDPDRKLIARRAYRESCIFSDGSYTKDLTVLGVDLAKVAIIDNTPQVFRLQVNNGIPIKSWFDDPSDHALISLIPFLETLADADDVRPIIAKTFGIKE
ncbi:CTD small phosphatase-like protein 2 [Melia azedarach]|uniref:CTD small phosphatase-like protein 2 n=1 Tax=Melia azedarach TaxID=155640 RepID=A0ACC1YB65_MELAZ|nr:CTD small phosphatase-like protein 2 [Melia azedarach]